MPKRQSLNPLKRYKHPIVLPNAWRLSQSAARLLWQDKQLFIGIVLVYGVLNLLLVRGFSGGTDVGSLKHNLDLLSHGQFASLGTSLTVFTVLVGSAGGGSASGAGSYQLILGIIASLAFIWALRQTVAGKAIRIRDPYYSGMYPLVPFVLVLLVIAVQLLPLVIGSSLYSVVVTNGIAVHAYEKLLWALFCLILGLVSLYMVTSSLFSVYIVTLPNMTPRKALRSARDLVKFRRWSVLRKMLFFPTLLFVLAALIMVPIIIWLSAIAAWVFFLLSIFSLLALHAYMYGLYRELLNE